MTYIFIAFFVYVAIHKVLGSPSRVGDWIANDSGYHTYICILILSETLQVFLLPTAKWSRVAKF